MALIETLLKPLQLQEAAETPLKGQEVSQGSERAEGYGATPP